MHACMRVSKGPSQLSHFDVCCCFLEQETSLTLLQSAKHYKFLMYYFVSYILYAFYLADLSHRLRIYAVEPKLIGGKGVWIIKSTDFHIRALLKYSNKAYIC